MIESVYDEITDCEYVIQYQNIIDTFHFLLSYKFFNDDIIYVSVWHYNNKNKQIYSKMHTEDW